MRTLSWISCLCGLLRLGVLGLMNVSSFLWNHFRYQLLQCLSQLIRCLVRIEVRSRNRVSLRLPVWYGQAQTLGPPVKSRRPKHHRQSQSPSSLCSPKCCILRLTKALDLNTISRQHSSPSQWHHILISKLWLRIQLAVRILEPRIRYMSSCSFAVIFLCRPSVEFYCELKKHRFCAWISRKGVFKNIDATNSGTDRLIRD